MKTSHSRQKSYSNQRRKPLKFVARDHVFFRVTSPKGVGRAIKSKKLSLKFIGPYQILRKIGPVTYEISLPLQLAHLHNVFPVSQLKKYVRDLNHVLDIDDVQIKENLIFEVRLERIENQQTKQLRGKAINMVKVLWDAKSRDSTWELEETIKNAYPHPFTSKSIFEDEKFSF